MTDPKRPEDVPTELAEAVHDYLMQWEPCDLDHVAEALAAVLPGRDAMVRQKTLSDVVAGRVTIDEWAKAQGVQPVRNISELTSKIPFTDEEIQAFNDGIRIARGGGDDG